MNKELFIHVGFPKCASTFMQKTFLPAIRDVTYIGKFPPDRKRQMVSYDKQSTSARDKRGDANSDLFSSGWFKRIYKDFPQYFDESKIRNELSEQLNKVKGNKIVCSDEGLTGFLTHDPAMAPIIARRLKEIVPDAHIIIVLRNQVSLISSLYRMYVASGGSCKLSTLLNRKEEITGTLHDTIFMAHLKYDYLIQTYFDLFGEKNVFVAFFEDLCRNQSEFLIRLLGFMGSDDVNSCQCVMKHNVGSALNIGVTMKRVINSVMRSRRYPDNPLPYIPLGILSVCRKIPSCSFKKYFGVSLYNEIVEYYQRSNEALLDMLGQQSNDELRSEYFVRS